MGRVFEYIFLQRIAMSNNHIRNAQHHQILGKCESKINHSEIPFHNHKGYDIKRNDKNKPWKGYGDI